MVCIGCVYDVEVEDEEEVEEREHTCGMSAGNESLTGDSCRGDCTCGIGTRVTLDSEEISEELQD